MTQPKSIQKSFQLFKNIDVYNLMKKCTFEEAVNIITNKNNLIIVNNFINALKNTIKFNKHIISNRIFLSAYLITFFKEDVLGTSNELNNEELDIYNSSHNLVNLVNNLNINSIESICLFIGKLSNYKHIFNKWKHKDLESQVTHYLNIYYDCKYKVQIISNIDDHQELHINNMNILIEKIKLHIITLIGINEFNKKIQEYEKNIEKNKKMLRSVINISFKKIYWTKLRKELKSDPPNYSQIKGLIIDIKSYFRNIYNNKTRMIYLDEYLDEEFIDKQINFEVFGNVQIIAICTFLLTQVKTVDIPNNDSNIEQYITKLDSQLDKEHFINVIIEVLSYIMNRLEFISNFMDKIRK